MMTEPAPVSSFVQAGLLPAVTLEDAESAVRVAEALLEGGLNVMEVTFRTRATTDSITAIAKQFPEMHIGAGTILTADQVSAAKDAGAQFGLAPGFNPEVTGQATKNNFPFIPGVTTPSEIEQALGHGFKLLKLFPVTSMGGDGYIRKLEGPYGHTGIGFITMGGVNPSNLRSLLGCSSVRAAGGSFLAPKELIANKQYNQITATVQKALDTVREVQSAC